MWTHQASCVFRSEQEDEFYKPQAEAYLCGDSGKRKETLIILLDKYIEIMSRACLHD